MTFDREKFKALVHYIIARTGEGDGLEAAKLDRLLWLIDTRSYALRGSSVTGAIYIREEEGPVPPAIVTTRMELEKEGKIRITTEPGTNTMRLLVVLAPDLSLLSKDEIAIANWGLDKHSLDPWMIDRSWDIAPLGEELPLSSAFASRIRAPDGDELEWARAVASQLAR
ncbi:MAG: DUF4065 domain-containing protein [Methylobacteriaceae bacterium]|nr:DUF4065 domain-containing protein [Methylobacteriaceae bacterium]